MSEERRNLTQNMRLEDSRRRRVHLQLRPTFEVAQRRVYMNCFLVLILQLLFQSCVQAIFFTTEVERPSYEAELGEDVLMACRFFPLPPNPPQDVTVSWFWMASDSVREVCRLDNGVEQLGTQHPDFRGRARLLTEDIKDGWAKLQVSRLGIQDSGTYQCMVKTSDGADYRDIKLSVTAPYKTVSKHIRKSAEGAELVLGCQSEGYPESAVSWQDAGRRVLAANTTVRPTQARLFRVSSQIHVASLQENNYTCTFDTGGSSATFHIPGLTLFRALLATCIVAAGICLLAVLTRRRKKELCREDKKLKDEEETTFCKQDCLEGFRNAGRSKPRLQKHLEEDVATSTTSLAA
ncbi:programmed cell death 1 ligand 1-like isoform X2 [Nerophis ophidion]|uniref:programmed cell death 1 ligand 1-like isoform X2 n=1 Tax=Nerophis ophidion TaxID=159077 RepID=UPI002AE057E2|nr:programmed cell death 1 ligand 1-like isoform X2 [Nerophis ophidion]